MGGVSKKIKRRNEKTKMGIKGKQINKKRQNKIKKSI